MKSLLTFFCVMLIACSKSEVDSKKNECPRVYDNDVKTYEIRQRVHEWNIGSKKVQSWTPLKCSSELNINFLNATNNQILHKEGEAHTGRNAAFVFYPSLSFPAKTIFTVNSENLFGENTLEINLPTTGQVFLNGKVYEKSQVLVNGMSVIVFSEPNNPSKESAVHILKMLSDLFPKRTQAIIAQGEIHIVIARNSTEKFQATPIRFSGRHNPKYLFVVLFSQDGTGVEEHLLHEIGGLFRIPSNRYAHGLTWMIAYDQMEKMANSPALKLKRQCVELNKVISNLKKAAGPDFTHPIGFYVDDVYARNGWPIYAWGAGFYWKKINTILTEKKLPNIYDLLNNMKVERVRGQAKDLDQLLLAYKKMNAKGFKTFEMLVMKYFRLKNLEQLLKEARLEELSLGCNSTL